jgi:AmmeMemoRadiSam system protein B
MIRREAVAGQFYPGGQTSLLREVESLIDSKAPKSDAFGVVSPHAGYVYSGSVAGNVLSCLKNRENYIILGPNHTGLGEAFGVDPSDAWRTPLGDVALSDRLRKAILSASGLFKPDKLCHAHEHSIEVQIPFLQVLQQSFELVPIVIAQSDLGTYRELGAAIASAVRSLKLERKTTIIASSDMTHYEPHEEAKRKDSSAIEALMELDEERLLDSVSRLDISMCGVAPAAVMLVAAKALGARSGRLIRYQTSGDTSGDYSSVVGYAGIIIE